MLYGVDSAKCDIMDAWLRSSRDLHHHICLDGIALRSVNCLCSYRSKGKQCAQNLSRFTNAELSRYRQDSCLAGMNITPIKSFMFKPSQQTTFSSVNYTKITPTVLHPALFMFLITLVLPFVRPSSGLVLYIGKFIFEANGCLQHRVELHSAWGIF